MSSNKEKVELKIKLSADWFRVPPRCKVFVDDQLIAETELSERRSLGEKKEISYVGDLEEGKHTIKIQYLGKTFPDTRVDEAGNILEDHGIHIENIEIDDIDLGFMCFSHSVYRPDRRVHHEAPEEMLQTVDLGYNGTWSIEFEVPTYIWFLENL